MSETSRNVSVRSSFLPFALPDVGDEELSEIKDALASGWVTTGPKVSKFEAEFAKAVSAKHAVAVNSCTAAMHLALEAIGLQHGDEVITTPYTFAATAEVVRYFDAKPVFVDIMPDTFNINPDLIEAAITSHTRAIIPVHIGGLHADMDAIHRIAKKHGLAVIEDAAHLDPLAYQTSAEPRTPNPEPQTALPSEAVCFSFYATKTITTGEGGMVVTNSDTIAERCRIMALHGISKDAWKRYTAEGSWYYEIIAPGFKYNMTDVAAAMGLAQLSKAERMLKRRRQIAKMYDDAFAPNPKLQVPSSNDGHAWHLYMLRLNVGRGWKSEVGGQKSEVRGQMSEVGGLWSKVGQVRARFIEELKKRNIGTSVHFIPLHLHPYYRQAYGYKPEDFPVAYREYLKEVSLPIYSRMSDADVADVIDAVLALVGQYS
jgi:dTDP-4-amino-4,6-dideoxygalactose transaminase